ncbi:alanine racemase [Domibacillus sp. A3M-37]|uniref:alanine racemase n=1 Tax=Domibacillus sp. A3M-37 TaxID=2962037 RepID=UPI0020B900D7|nr:alanine racemase [Domibacillus sp. A3M-37]MCP3764030.1 alanine racemase [Domibacillus sp. A3M-37]
MKFYRDTWAEINLDAIKWNVEKTMEHLDPSVFLFAVVKANAYGHGDLQVARAALKSGAKGLAVAFLDEAIKLRASGIDAPILVLGAIRPEDAHLAATKQISVTVHDEDWLTKACVKEDQLLNIHIKCDTGMGRIGLKTKEELQYVVRQIDQSAAFVFEGIFTHFATADERETGYMEKQLAQFRQLIDSLLVKPPFIHCSNSAATLRFKGSGCNAVRLGISMYGLTPSTDITPLLPFGLKPAFSLKSKLVQVKKLEPGEKVSYGATYEASGHEWIGTLPIGYADGWIRKLGGQDVLIDGRRVPIVGRICMDQCMVRLPKEYKPGTLATLIGRQQNQEITMEEIAKKRETINYEIPCVITSRVPRVYIQEGKIVSIVNSLL